MKKYFRALFYMIWPNYKQVRSLYMQDVAGIIDYLRTLKVGEELKRTFFVENPLSSLKTVFKYEGNRVIEVGLYRYWDLKQEFSPIFAAYLIVEENSNRLIALSFDRELFKQILTNKQIIL